MNVNYLSLKWRRVVLKTIFPITTKMDGKTELCVASALFWNDQQHNPSSLLKLLRTTVELLKLICGKKQRILSCTYYLQMPGVIERFRKCAVGLFTFSNDWILCCSPEGWNLLEKYNARIHCMWKLFFFREFACWISQNAARTCRK